MVVYRHRGGHTSEDTIDFRGDVPVTPNKHAGGRGID